VRGIKMGWKRRTKCAPAVHRQSKTKHHEDEEEVQMGEKRLYTGYSQVEVKEIRENGVVMNDGEDGKDCMLGMETVKNG
jgi:hypothetical protein